MMPMNPYQMVKNLQSQELRQNFQAFQQNFAQNNPNLSPRDKVMELLNSGQMSMETFETLRNIAESLKGKI